MLIRDARWKDSADVVVVGYGGAGAVAAITAQDLGAQVLILEKQPQDRHYTNTQMSGGVFLSPTDVEKSMGYVEALYRVEGDMAWTDRATLQAWAEYSHQNKAWVEGLGGAHLKLYSSAAEHRELPDWDCFEQWQFAGSGLGLHRFLTSQVSQRGIRVRFNARAQKLLTDINGEVLGVRVGTGEGGEPMDIRAHRAVILTTGGFEFDETMKLNYLKVYPTHFYGTPANTGDGHRMAMELGADLWHMNCCSARLVAKFPDFPIAFSMNLGGKSLATRHLRDKAAQRGEEPCGYIVVDRDGRRYTSENFKLHAVYYELALYDSHRLLYPRVPSFWIFDQRRMESGLLPTQLAGPAGPVQLYKWSRDNQVELEKGWIIRGESVAELADKLGMPSANLMETVRRYNRYCQQGEDPEFHRRPGSLAPICNPPFYAVRLYPGGPHTHGGPRRNYRSQVLNLDGDPIPRLYAAGEMGSVYGLLYPSGGGGIGECFAFGRIAAENAVREESRP